MTEVAVVCDVCGHEFTMTIPPEETQWLARCPECDWPVSSVLDAKEVADAE